MDNDGLITGIRSWTWGQVQAQLVLLRLTKTERKIMSYSFWIVALILVHVAFLFMVPWE